MGAIFSTLEDSNVNNQSLLSIPQLAESMTVSEPECSESLQGNCDPSCYGFDTIGEGDCRYVDSTGAKISTKSNTYGCSNEASCASDGSEACVADSRCMGISHDSVNSTIKAQCSSKSSVDGICKTGGTSNIENLTYQSGSNGSSNSSIISCLNATNLDQNSTCYSLYNCDNTSTESSTSMDKDFPFTSSYTGGVTFYQNYNGGGYAVTLKPGFYKMADLIAAGIKNDDVSSVKVPNGYYVYLYKNNNFSGTRKFYYGSSNTRNLYGFNDKMSSCKIFSYASKKRCNMARTNIVARPCGCQNCWRPDGTTSGPACSAEQCNQYCKDNEDCTHAFSNYNGGCILYNKCDTSTYSGTGGQIYKKNTDTTTSTTRNDTNESCSQECLASSEGAFTATSCDIGCYGFKQLDSNGYCKNSTLGDDSMSYANYHCYSEDSNCVQSAANACCADNRCKAFSNDVTNSNVRFNCSDLTSETGPCQSGGSTGLYNLSAREVVSKTNTNTNNCFDTTTTSIDLQTGKCYTKNDCTDTYQQDGEDCICNTGCIRKKDMTTIVSCEDSNSKLNCSNCDNDYTTKYYSRSCDTEEELNCDYRCKDTNEECNPDFVLPSLPNTQECQLDLSGEYDANSLNANTCACADYSFSITDNNKYADCTSSTANAIDDNPITNSSLSDCKNYCCAQPTCKSFSFGTINGTKNTCILRNSSTCALGDSDDSVFYTRTGNLIDNSNVDVNPNSEITLNNSGNSEIIESLTNMNTESEISDVAGGDIGSDATNATSTDDTTSNAKTRLSNLVDAVNTNLANRTAGVNPSITEVNVNSNIVQHANELLQLSADDNNDKLQKLYAYQREVATKEKMASIMNSRKKKRSILIKSLVIIFIIVVISFIPLALMMGKIISPRVFVLIFIILCIIGFLVFCYANRYLYVRDFVENISPSASTLASNMSSITQNQMSENEQSESSSSSRTSNLMSDLYGDQAEWVANNCDCPVAETTTTDTNIPIPFSVTGELVWPEPGFYYDDGSAPNQLLVPKNTSESSEFQFNEKAKWPDYNRRVKMAKHSLTNKYRENDIDDDRLVGNTTNTRNL